MSCLCRFSINQRDLTGQKQQKKKEKEGKTVLLHTHLSLTTFIVLMPLAAAIWITACPTPLLAAFWMTDSPTDKQTCHLWLQKYVFPVPSSGRHSRHYCVLEKIAQPVKIHII